MKSSVFGRDGKGVPMSLAIWIAGGTTEGRKLAEYLAGRPLAVYVSVATAYGASLIPKAPNITVIVQRMDYGTMASFMTERHIDLVVDATHPYAEVVTENVKKACAVTSTEYIRVVRSVSSRHDYASVSSMKEAVEFLGHTEGAVFLTTGSKDLSVFTALPDYAERIALRILSSRASLETALSLGFKAARIVCMQGPFKRDLNAAMFRHFQAAYVVTKDSGKMGGFEAKLNGARDAGAQVVVVTRDLEKGTDCQSVCRVLDTWLERNQ